MKVATGIYPYFIDISFENVIQSFNYCRKIKIKWLIRIDFVEYV